MTDTNARPSVDAGEEPESREPSSQASDAKTIDPNDHASVAAEYKDKLLRVGLSNAKVRTLKAIAKALDDAYNGWKTQ